MSPVVSFFILLPSIERSSTDYIDIIRNITLVCQSFVAATPFVQERCWFFTSSSFKCTRLLLKVICMWNAQRFKIILVCNGLFFLFTEASLKRLHQIHDGIHRLRELNANKRNSSKKVTLSKLISLNFQRRVTHYNREV